LETWSNSISDSTTTSIFNFCDGPSQKLKILVVDILVTMIIHIFIYSVYCTVFTYLGRVKLLSAASSKMCLFT